MKTFMYHLFKQIFRFFASFIYPIKIIHKKRIPKKSKHIVVSNHISWVDILQLLIQTPGRRHMVAKKELQKSRFIRFWNKVTDLDIVWIDRENFSLASVKKILDLLKRGRAICIFPEGTRNKESRELLELKSGTAVFAIKAKAPIVPVMIYARPRVFRRNYVYVGEPFELSEFYDARLTPDLTARADALLREHMLKEMENMDDYIQNKRWKRKNRL